MSESQISNVKQQLKIDSDLLIAALQNHGIEAQFFLNLETGEIMLAGDGMVNGEEGDIDDFLDEFPDLYIEIEGIPSSKGFGLMETFVQDHAPMKAKDALWRALEKKKPFRQFKDALVEMDDVSAQWAAFEEASYLALAKKWLEEHKINGELVKALSSA